MGENPTDANSRPIHADTRPLNILPLEIARTMVMATKHSAKYSQGPMRNAISAMVSLRRAAIIALKKVPVKDATIPMARAFPDLPCLLMGYPSQQVETAEAEPGIPKSTEPIKAPEHPPIHKAMRKITAVPAFML